MPIFKLGSSTHLQVIRLFLGICCFMGIIEAKILIFTSSYNRPDFIETQYKTFKKFLKEKHKLIVFNDAIEEHLSQQITETCNRLKIKCIRIPQEIHDRPYLKRYNKNYHAPSVRNCNVVQYALDTVGFDHDDIVMIVDADIFLVKEFSIRDYMQNLDLAGYLRTRETVKYLWIGLVFLNMATMPNKKTINFNCGYVENTLVDSGGYTYYYLRDNPQAKVGYFNELCLSDFVCKNYELREYDNAHITARSVLKRAGYEPEMITFIKSGPTDMELFMNGTFLHYCGACNWARQSTGYHTDKSQILNDFLEKVTNN